MKSITVTNTSEPVLFHEKGDALYRIEKDVTVIIAMLVQDGSQSITLEFIGENASASIIGVGRLSKNQHAVLQTHQLHKAPKTTSNLLVKTVISDAASVIYNGSIRVEKNAQQTNAYQRNENLLLSESADVQTKPSLEIFADNVRCTHGATVGTIDEQQLYYVQSRGIPRMQAEDMLAVGFLEAALTEIQNTQIYHHMIAKLEAVSQ